MAECRSSSDFDFVREKASTTIVGYEPATGSHPSGDLVQALPAEIGCAVYTGERVSARGLKGSDNLRAHDGG